jgi:hypothetical protein
MKVNEHAERQRSSSLEFIFRTRRLRHVRWYLLDVITGRRPYVQHCRLVETFQWFRVGSKKPMDVDAYRKVSFGSG